MDNKNIIDKIATRIFVEKQEAEKILEKAIAGGEVNEDAEQWFEERFLPNIVFIDEKGYSQMCINALKILGTTAATDYGSSRQRDLGQLWADMTRGYLGEFAFSLFLKEKWNIDSELGHEVGQIADYLPTDIHSVKKQNEELRPPKISIGIKTTKWNGIWLDLPGDQFNHSDVHLLVKVGTGRDHLFAFFKKISVFKDKILRIGREVGSLSDDEANNLFDALPSFRPIPAYICGFIDKSVAYAELSYAGKIGRKNYKITSWNGQIKAGDLSRIKKNENVTGKVSFEGIGEFSHDSGYLFNAGNLQWSQNDWQRIVDKM